MAQVRTRDTAPERALRVALWSLGFRYRLHYPVVGIRPDFVFVGKRVAVFVDGCFWHGCPEHYTVPKTRHAFWNDKLGRNVERDIRQTSELESKGWRVVRVWEHEVRFSLEASVQRVRVALKAAPAVIQSGSEARVYSVECSEDGSKMTYRLTELRKSRQWAFDRFVGGNASRNESKSSAIR